VGDHGVARRKLPSTETVSICVPISARRGVERRVSGIRARVGGSLRARSSRRIVSMKPIKLWVNVSLASAVARGTTNHGDAVVELSDSDVAALSEAARGEILRARDASCVLMPDQVHDRSYGYVASPLAVDVADVPHALVALEARAAARAELLAKPAREREARILEALSRPDSEWIAARSSDWYVVNDAGAYAEDGKRVYRPIAELPHPLYADESSDPRIMERRDLIRARTLAPVDREWLSRKQSWDLFVDAKRRDREMQETAYASAIVLLASNEDDLARAASEGYDVEKAMLDRLAEKLSADVKGRRVSFVGASFELTISSGTDDVFAEIDTCHWKSPTERAAPSPDMFRLLDRVTTAVKCANKTIPGVVGQWEVSRIVRVDTCPHDGEHHWVTAILATFLTLGPRKAEREITFSLESQECEHDAE
jgi:hypothetical protein